jgi:serine/threonine-protein kinase HipA
MMRCLYCYELLEPDQKDFHPSCSKKIFGTATPPLLPLTEEHMKELATKIIRSQFAITGVQPKLSLEIEKITNQNNETKFTIVGVLGNYILKPPTKQYPELPEVEDLTMHLATIAGIRTVPHSLVRLQSGNLAYITKRIDRDKKKKIHMEDMCQLTERLTEHKYRGSHEQIAKAILNFSINPGLDVINYYEQVLFSFLTGNADMHLKNFSLIDNPKIGYTLSPAYDMVATSVLIPEDKEELALNLNGKKKKITKKDFSTAFSIAKIDLKAQENIFKKFENAIPDWAKFIEISFLSPKLKSKYKEKIQESSKRIF